jgi:hypothetical protein
VADDAAVVRTGAGCVGMLAVAVSAIPALCG